MKIKDRIIKTSKKIVPKIKKINRNKKVDKKAKENFDTIKSCLINSTIKGAIFNNGSDKYFENNKEKSRKGLIDVDELLEKEVVDNDINDIVFCDKEQVICLTGQRGGRYIEQGHEYFIDVNDQLYIICDDKDNYNSFKEYVKQSSKWHSHFKESDKIPDKDIFDKLFTNKELKAESNQNVVEQTSKVKPNENTIEIDGIVNTSSKIFTKRDNKKSKFITITQEDVYNGKKSNYSISVSMEEDVLNKYGNEVAIGDKVRIKGKLVNYLDKDKNLKFIVNSSFIEILEKAKIDAEQIKKNRVHIIKNTEKGMRNNENIR